MRQKRRRRPWGLLLAVVLAVLALGAIALMVARPARVIGVSEASIAESVEAGGPFRCVELKGGRLKGTAWRCTAGEDEPPMAVQADEWGCWESRRIGRDGGRRSGCIWLMDYVQVLD